MTQESLLVARQPSSKPSIVPVFGSLAVKLVFAYSWSECNEQEHLAAQTHTESADGQNRLEPTLATWPHKKPANIPKSERSDMYKRKWFPAFSSFAVIFQVFQAEWKRCSGVGKNGAWWRPLWGDWTQNHETHLQKECASRCTKLWNTLWGAGPQLKYSTTALMTLGSVLGRPCHWVSSHNLYIDEEKREFQFLQMW